MNTEKMLKEEKELESKLFGTPESAETKVDEAPGTKPEEQDAPDVTVAVTTEYEKPSENEGTDEREEDWKLRYTNLRNSRDTKLYDTQKALAVSEATVSTLQQKISELMSSMPAVEVDIFKDAFTEEEREALGPTAIAAMQKTAKLAAEAKTSGIQKELKEARDKANAEAKANASNVASQAYETFIKRLGAVVPDYAQVDADPRFKAFMDKADIDGTTRVQNFIAAEARGDVATVARHMVDFKNSLNPKAQAKASLEAKVTPTGLAKAQGNTVSKETNGDLTMSEVNEHYRKYARGGYKGRQSEYLAMEARIDAAASSGKIRG